MPASELKVPMPSIRQSIRQPSPLSRESPQLEAASPIDPYDDEKAIGLGTEHNQTAIEELQLCKNAASKEIAELLSSYSYIPYLGSKNFLFSETKMGCITRSYSWPIENNTSKC
jgi:hypothetical protein